MQQPANDFRGARRRDPSLRTAESACTFGAVSGYIDLAAWKRRQHFELFHRAAQPWFSITAEVDVTGLRSRRDSRESAFFLSALYAALCAANETEAFRLRLRGEAVWAHDALDVTSTIMRDDETFGFGRFPMRPTLDDFLLAGARELQRARRVEPLDLPMAGDDALIYHSSLPWLRFTAFTNAITILDDSVPRIVFGRRTQEANRQSMPVSVEVHHALVDGLDVARFFERMQLHLDGG